MRERVDDLVDRHPVRQRRVLDVAGISSAFDHSQPSPMSVFQLMNSIGRPLSSKIVRRWATKPPFSQVRPAGTIRGRRPAGSRRAVEAAEDTDGPRGSRRSRGRGRRASSRPRSCPTRSDRGSRRTSPCRRAAGTRAGSRRRRRSSSGCPARRSRSTDISNSRGSSSERTIGSSTWMAVAVLSRRDRFCSAAGRVDVPRLAVEVLRDRWSLRRDSGT